jgi:hypothetical protein
LETKRKKRVKILALLATIWFAVTLPLPWLWMAPEETKPQVFILLQIVGLISIPFIVLAVVWTIKPELTT